MPEPPHPIPQRERGPRAPRLALCLLAIVLLVALSGVQTAWGQAASPKAPVTVRAGGQEADVIADQIEERGGPNNLLIAVGNVEITQGATRLLADRVELNRDTGDAVAQGKVVFFDGQDRLVADRVDYNLKTGTGVVYNGSTFSPPYYHLFGERLDRVGEGVYNIHRGVFTTCEGDEPAWSFKIGSGVADLDDLVYGRDASFWVRDLPLIPWVPFFAAALRRERQSGFLFPEFGDSSTKGFFARVPYYWAINDSQDLTVGLDTFSRRGVGVDAEYRYLFSQQAKGIVSGFLIPETLRSSQDRQRLDLPETRGFYTLKHDWQITPGLSFKADSTLTTDDLVFREYGNRLTDRSRQQAATNVFVSQRWDTWSLVGRAFYYQDLTTPAHVELQRLPEIRLQALRQPVPWASALLYELDSSFTNFRRIAGSEGVRGDFHPRLFLPVPVAGLFTLTPFAGGRLTYYNREVVGNKVVVSNNSAVTVEDTINTDRLRQQVETGVTAESRASRVYTLEGAGGIAALQHVIAPRAILTEIWGVNQKALPQWDPGAAGSLSGIDQGFETRAGVDKIGRINQVTYQLANRLNAKTVSGPNQEPVRWELAHFILAQTYKISGGRGQPLDDLTGEVAVSPSQAFRFRADAAYNMYGLGLRQGNTDLTALYRDVAVTVGSRFNGITSVNSVNGEVAARITRGLSVHAATNWDVRKGLSVESRVGFDLVFSCWAIMAEYVNRHTGGNDVRFSINLLGLGEVGTKVGAGALR